MRALKNTLLLLRFPFSFFLMPVYWFALSQQTTVDTNPAIIAFCILHLLVYPASNGYNSYMDRDEGPIGGLKNPPKATKSLFYVTVVMDALAILLCFVISPLFAVLISGYILASRAYSYRGIRLKRYPIIGFLTVFIFQGLYIFFAVYVAVGNKPINASIWLAAIASSFLFGAVYPLTQIYQHEQDKADDIISISYKLGYMGTFAFVACMFSIATGILYCYFTEVNAIKDFWLMQIALAPVVGFFLFWWKKVWNNTSNANFEYTMYMNLIASLCLNIAFVLMYIL